MSTGDPLAALTPSDSSSFVSGRLGMERCHSSDLTCALPHDVRESQRLDFQHYIFRQVLGGLHTAPLSDPLAVLDIGCGTGRWAREMALKFPHTQVVGLDVRTPRPVHVLPAAGCFTFIEHDVNSPLPFDDESFDYVHIQLMYSSVSASRWPGLLAEVLRITRRGGWVESVESSLPTMAGPALTRMINWWYELAEYQGIDVQIALHLPRLMRMTGLCSVTHRGLDVPAGDRAGRAGSLMATDGVAIMDRLRPAILALGITTAREYDRVAARSRGEMKEYRIISPVHVSLGQRP